MTEQEREVMQQRLEALETAHDDSLDGQEFSCRQILMEQITALREALAAPQPACGEMPPEWFEGMPDEYRLAAWRIKNEPAQDPVGYISKTGHGTYFRETLTDELKSLEWADEKMWKAVFYAAPHQRQPLTDEFVRLVVRSKQPNLSTESKAWKDLFASCKYWLDAAHGITKGSST